ncbi:hypothetical protein PRN20_06045 [Devosia sp. ZB163]|uniref:hypothetical protein n=1 Tax=Devosia sp. ZB163 TaxID=3025938 RepID=UPI00235EDBDF|nr:hypothetical protein [Devosia sp. ZB163]MDC9823286.1 hypothetical protein [Devosia sp. ZB163]
MNISTVVNLIETTPLATCEAEEFAEYMSEVFERIGQPRRKLTSAQSVELLAGYLWSALDWNVALDPAAKTDGTTLGEHPRSRISLIKQLERIGEVFGWDLKPGRKQPRLGDRPIPTDVVDALEKKGVLGPLLVSFPDPLDGRPRRDDLRFVELGEKNVDAEGTAVPEDHDETVFGFHDPSHLTADEAANSRKLKRKFALASKFGAPASLRVDQATWELGERSRQAIENAEPFAGGIFASLKGARDLLSGKETSPMQKGLPEEGQGFVEARKNLATTARRAARFLEIEFQMTDRQRNNQSGETIASWTRPSPLLEFGRTIFELLAPTRGGEGLNEIAMPGDVGVDLQKEAVDAALEGAKHARHVLRILKWKLRWRSIHIAKVELLDPNDGEDTERPPANAHYLDRGSPVMYASEHQRKTTGRLEEGRQRVLERLWSLRDSSVKLRALTEMFHVRHAKLLERGGNYGPLRKEMLEKVATPTLDWYRELAARFDEGVVYEADIKRRTGGVPNEVPTVPAALERYRMELEHDPELMVWGARPDEAVIKAVLEAMDPSGSALAVWREAIGILEDDTKIA